MSDKGEKKTSTSPPGGPAEYPGLAIDKMYERMRVAYEEGGDPHALLDALKLTFEIGSTNKLPDWALAGAIDIVSSAVSRGITCGKGRNGRADHSDRKQD